MDFLFVFFASLAVSAIISILWAGKLTEYYESGQYVQDVIDGLYDDNMNDC